MLLAIWDDLRNLGQGAPRPSVALAVGASDGGAESAICKRCPRLVLLVSAISMLEWMGLKLSSFGGNVTAVVAAEWLTYVDNEKDVEDVVYHVSLQILKGETLM